MSQIAKQHGCFFPLFFLPPSFFLDPLTFVIGIAEKIGLLAAGSADGKFGSFIPNLTYRRYGGFVLLILFICNSVMAR